MHAGQAEHHLDAVVFEQLDDQLGAGRHPRRILSRLHPRAWGNTMCTMSMTGISRRVVAVPVKAPAKREDPAPRRKPDKQPKPAAKT